MSEQSSKKIKTIQTTLNFTTEFYTTSILRNQTANIQKPKLTSNKTQKSILDFLPTSNIIKKRSFKEIITRSDDETNDNGSESEDDDDNSSFDSDYELCDELVNFLPNICQKGKKIAS